MTLITVGTLNAAEVKIQPGESIWLRPSIDTVVTCVEGTALNNCDNAVNTFKFRMNSCRNGGYNFSSCYNWEWTPFKNANPNCVDQVVPFCITECQSGGYGYNTCQSWCR